MRKKLRKIDFIIIELIAIVIAVLFVCLVLAPPHHFAPFLREEYHEGLRSQPLIEIYAVDHEINNLSDMYIGFEFDNSTFTVNVDITNDSIYIWGIQPEYGPAINIKVNNETINWYSQGQSSTDPNFLYIRWKVLNLQYGENVTFFFSGKGRAIASDLMW